MLRLFMVLFAVVTFMSFNTRIASAFSASKYAECHARSFAKHIKDGDFYHDWWIRPEFDDITSHHQAPLYIRSSLRCLYDVKTCSTPFELLVRENGQYELKVSRYYYITILSFFWVLGCICINVEHTTKYRFQVGLIQRSFSVPWKCL